MVESERGPRSEGRQGSGGLDNGVRGCEIPQSTAVYFLIAKTSVLSIFRQ